MPHCNISIFGVDVAAREFIFHKIVINFVCCKVYSISFLRAVFFSLSLSSSFHWGILLPPLALWSSVRVFSVHAVHILDLFLASKHGVNMLFVKNTPWLLLLLLLLCVFFSRFVLLSVILCVQSTRTPGSLFFISPSLLLLLFFRLLFLGKYYLSIYSVFFFSSFIPVTVSSLPLNVTAIMNVSHSSQTDAFRATNMPTTNISTLLAMQVSVEMLENGSAFPSGQPTALLIRNGTRTPEFFRVKRFIIMIYETANQTEPNEVPRQQRHTT